jgi:hypothetical protein
MMNLHHVLGIGSLGRSNKNIETNPNKIRNIMQKSFKKKIDLERNILKKK